MQVYGDTILLRLSDAIKFEDDVEFTNMVIGLAKQTSCRRRGPVKIDYCGFTLYTVDAMEDFKNAVKGRGL